MNWLPLEENEFTKIADSIKYTGQSMKTSDLYKKIAGLECKLESKVKFILKHWGWNGIDNEIAKTKIAEIQSCNFSVFPYFESFFKQVYGLRLPIKYMQGQDDNYGGTMIFSFLRSLKLTMPASELLSIKFDDDVLPIGYGLDYNGYSNPLDGWENPNFNSHGAWDYELFLGNSGRIYFWFRSDSDYFGVAANNSMDFFASSFGLVPDTWKGYGYMDRTDLDLMNKIYELYVNGTYRQSSFKK